MPRFEILSTTAANGHLVVRSRHYHPDGAFWFEENHVFQGREGLKRKIQRNARGEALLQTGKVAPSRVNYYGFSRQSLPAGESWLLQTQGPFSNKDVLSAIRATHLRRLAEGWPQGRIDQVGPLPGAPADLAGIGQVMARVSLKGYQE